MAQVDLNGENVGRDVMKERKETVTYTLTSAHFHLKVTETALDKIRDIDEPQKRIARLVKNVKARPEAEEIPRGAKALEAVALATAALNGKGE